MSDYLSRKISVLSMICILGVLVIHTPFTEAEGFALASFIQRFVGGQLVRFSVPLFFLISGYLFFINVSKGNFLLIWTKLRRRVRSLIVPYFIWNTLFFMVIVALQFIPWATRFVNADFLSVLRQGIGSLIAFLYWEPAAFHLWFLQYLILFMSSTPLILVIFMNRYVASSFAILVYLILGAFCTADSYAQNYLFFVAGAYLSFYKIDVGKHISLSILAVALLIYFSWCLINTIYPAWSLPQCSILRSLLGAFCIWGAYDHIHQSFPKICHRLYLLSGFTFFVYLFHEPWINVYKKLALRILGVNEISLIVSYVLIPFIMYATCVVIARCIRRSLPRTYSTLTGGRI